MRSRYWRIGSAIVIRLGSSLASNDPGTKRTQDRCDQRIPLSPSKAAAAKTAEVITQEEFNRVSRTLPVLVNARPFGRYSMVDIDAKGGLPVIVRELLDAGLLDGSCMTSSAWQNPSLTYMALTARACDFAVNELKKGNL